MQKAILIFFAVALLSGVAAVVVPGADKLVADRYSFLVNRKKIGIVANPTTILQNFSHLVDVMYADRALINLVAVFGPEHGFRGDRQAGEGADTYIDERTGLTVYNTYGRNSSTLQRMILESGVDTIIYDIQDVGTRFYTFVSTMWDMMEAGSAVNLSLFVVLDRPNPLGGIVMDGPVLDPAYESFIGRLQIPLIHGLTVAEIAYHYYMIYMTTSKMFYYMVPCDGWTRDMTYEQTGLIWVPPSPNMPTLDTAFVYPGLGLLEGTVLSTGRGTTRPFETFGAPFFSWQFAQTLQNSNVPGAAFRETYYIPTFDRFQGNVTCGAQIYITDRSKFSPLRAGLQVITTARSMYPSQFQFYDHDFDLHMGTNRTRLDLLAGRSLDSITASWAADIAKFKLAVAPSMLYR